MEEKECAFWLASLERIGCKKAGKIIEYFGSAKEAFYGLGVLFPRSHSTAVPVHRNEHCK